MQLAPNAAPPAQRSFPSFDGTSLHYRAWLPEGSITRGIVLFHRGHEHGGRWGDVVAHLQSLQPAGTAFFAWDARGHGHSPGPRGHARHISDIVRDVQAFITFVQTEYGIEAENMAVIAQSVAAVVVGQWALDYAPRLRALVLATPALEVKLYIPLARRGLKLLQRFSQWAGRPQPYVRSYVTGPSLTHDRGQADIYDRDPLISKHIAVNILLGLYESAERLGHLGADIEIPTLILSARADWVIKNLPMRRLYRKLPHPLKSIRVYRDAYHALFHETMRGQVVEDVAQFIDECFSHEVDRRHLLAADRRGASFERYEWHKAGLPWLSPRRWAYRGMKLGMQTVGRLSNGIRRGLQSGFSSGLMLDYVYANRAQGFSLLGRVMDRTFLDSPGWTNIRVRRVHLQRLLRQALQALGTRPTVRVFDLAGGPGHYLVDLAEELPFLHVRVRDYNEAAVEEGRRRVAQLGLTRVEFEQGDAFEANSLDMLGKDWQIGIISGLLELFPDNARARIALAGAARAIEAGGFLIYTNQPWHPQLEMIAETLTHGDGQPWIMRCRSQAEMDALVGEAGFDKIDMLIDDASIFTVSLARRR